MAGFECSSHRSADGERLDLISATDHDAYAGENFRACVAVRDVLAATLPRASGRRDWASWLPTLEAARTSGVQVVWDLLHDLRMAEVGLLATLHAQGAPIPEWAAAVLKR